MDGKIQYELTLDTQKALASVHAISAESVRAGNDLSRSMQRAIDRADFASAAQNTQSMADGLTKAGGAAEELAKQLNKGHESIKHLSLLLGGMTLDVAGSALKAYGYNSEASLLQSAGQSALQLGLTGAMLGGSKGGVIGGVVGLAGGLAKGYFEDDARALEKSRKEAEEWTKSLSESTLAGNILRDSMRKIDAPEDLQKALDLIAEKMREIRLRSKLGLVDPGIAKAQIEGFQRIYRDNAKRLPELEQEAATNAGLVFKKNQDKFLSDQQQAVDLTTENIGRSLEKSRLSSAIEDAFSPSDKLRLLTERQNQLQNQIGLSLSALRDKDWVRRAKPEELAAAQRQYSEASSEFGSNESAIAAINRSLRNRGAPQLGIDSSGQSGGYMRGSIAADGSFAVSASADLARTTARNTTEMVALLKTIAGSKAGGATWQRK